ncbi:hypothetical protein V6N13_009174 [Hibiscus sabdariffa]
MSQKKRSKDKSKDKKMVTGSTNKFHALANDIGEVRRPRVASLGVATLMQEIKGNKKAHVEMTKKQNEVIAVASGGTGLKSSQ